MLGAAPDAAGGCSDRPATGAVEIPAALPGVSTDVCALGISCFRTSSSFTAAAGMDWVMPWNAPVDFLDAGWKLT